MSETSVDTAGSVPDPASAEDAIPRTNASEQAAGYEATTDSASRDADLLVEELSIDGMCGVY